MVKEKKGFSLFTPLVGTAVVVIAILVTTVMIQNDVRISRGLTASYEVSSQTTAAKLIKAASTVQIINNVRETVLAELDGDFEYSCTTSSLCKGYLENFIKHGDLETQLTTGATAIFGGITNSIETITNYEVVPGRCAINSDYNNQPDLCLSEALHQIHESGKAAVDIDLNDDLIIRIDSDILEEKQDAFIVSFESNIDANDRVSLSIIPESFTYRIEKIGLYIDATASILDDTSLIGFASVRTKLASQGIPENPNSFEMWKSGANQKVDITWDVEGSNFHIIFDKGVGSTSGVAPFIEKP